MIAPKLLLRPTPIIYQSSKVYNRRLVTKFVLVNHL